MVWLIEAGHWREGDPAILVVFDAGYDVTRLAWLLADLPAELLGRLRSDRVMQPGTMGRVVLPGKPQYGAARQVWNASHDHRPALITQPVLRPGRRAASGAPCWGAGIPDGAVICTAGAVSSHGVTDGRRGEVGGGAVNEVAGDVGEPLVAVAGVIAQHREGPVDVDAEPLGEFALGLLNEDPAVQRALELLGEGSRCGARFVLTAARSWPRRPGPGPIHSVRAAEGRQARHRTGSAPRSLRHVAASAAPGPVRNPALKAPAANRGHRWPGPWGGQPP